MSIDYIFSYISAIILLVVISFTFPLITEVYFYLLRKIIFNYPYIPDQSAGAGEYTDCISVEG